jgi:hypothetical protein
MKMYWWKVTIRFENEDGSIFFYRDEIRAKNIQEAAKNALRNWTDAKGIEITEKGEHVS